VVVSQLFILSIPPTLEILLTRCASAYLAPVVKFILKAPVLGIRYYEWHYQLYALQDGGRRSAVQRRTERSTGK